MKKKKLEHESQSGDKVKEGQKPLEKLGQRIMRAFVERVGSLKALTSPVAAKVKTKLSNDKLIVIYVT